MKKNQNFRQKNGILLMTKIIDSMVKEMKTILQLSLVQKS